MRHSYWTQVSGAVVLSVVAATVFAPSSQAALPAGTIDLATSAATRTTGVVQSAGRVTWADDRQVGGVAWTRPVTSTGPFALGNEGVVGIPAVLEHPRDGLAPMVAADGRRTAWQDGSGIEITDGAQMTTLGVGDTPMRMSGHQLLTVPGLDGSGFFIDLVTGQSAEMLHTEAIWGGAVYRTAMDVEAIEQVDPMTDVASTLVTAQQAALPADGNFTRLAREGDLLAWAWTSPSARGVGWRNVRTGASGAIPLPATAIPRIAVYGRYLLVVSYTSSMDPVTTTVLDTGSNATIYARTDDTSTPAGEHLWNADIGPLGLGWTTKSQQAKLTPLPDQHLVPRHEGNPLAAASFPASGNWTGEWVFTEPLTTCSVTLKNASGTTVRTLACNPTYAAQGEAVVAWDGKDGGGAKVRGGNYTWSVQAADADGDAVDVDGTSTSITGTVSVPAADPVSAFVMAAYQDFLSRQPTPLELLAATTGLGNGSLTKLALLRQLANSPEWLSVIVTKMYQDTLGRAPDAAGLSTWVDWIRTGRFTVAQAASLFYSSDEFYQGLGGGSLPTWVTQLYLKLLGRSPDPAGLSGWVTFSGTYGRAWVTGNFYGSPESRMTRVKNLYQALLHRDPDPTGWPFWADVIQRTGDIELAVSLAASPEYYDKAATRF